MPIPPLIRSNHHVIAMNPAEKPMLEERQTGDPIAPTVLPEIPSSDLNFDFTSVIGAPSPEQENFEKIQKRASNVMKLAQENDRLKAELKALTDRLKAAEELVGHPNPKSS